MIGCYDKIPDKSNSRKGVLTSDPTVQSVVAGTSHQQEHGSWSHCIPSQEAERDERCCCSFSLTFACSQDPVMDDATRIQGNLLEMWPEVCLLRLTLSPVELRVKINSGCDFAKSRNFTEI